jgi:two-component system response regulator DesR
MITVLVLEHPEAVRRAVCARLSIEPQLILIGAVGDRASAVRRARALRPDVIVIDAELPGLDLPATVRALRGRSPLSRLVVIGIDCSALADAVGGCPATLVGKDEGVDALVRAVCGVPLLPAGLTRPAVREPRDDAAALARRALDLERAADRGRALAHRAEAKVAGKRAGRIEPDPVVANAQEQPAWVASEGQLDHARPRVLDHVLEGLLSDAVEGLLGAQRHDRLVA